jgi:hypothetical protein
VAFGKTQAVRDWYLERIKGNINKIEEFVVAEILRIQNGGKISGESWHTSDEERLDIHYVEQKYPEGWGYYILNECKDKYKSEYYCMKTGAVCNIFLSFAPKDYKQLELLCGCEVPKIVKGWRYYGHFGEGNSILSVTDMVTQVGTPFEKYEVNRYKELYNEHNVGFNFTFSIGYSKRGLKQLLKNYQTK